MKFSVKLRQVLDNFATINPSLLFREGTVLTTISPTKGIIASAAVDVEFPKTFAIYDMKRFLGALSLFTDPEVEVGDNGLVVTDGVRTMGYTFANPELIVAPADRKVVMPDTFIEFQLSDSALSRALKAKQTLGLSEISFVGANGELAIGVVDVKNPTADTYREKLGETDKTFRALIKSDNMKFIPDTYDVTLTNKGLCKFAGTIAEYYVGVDKESKYE